MKRTKISCIQPSLIGEFIEIRGWVRTLRAQKNLHFIEVNDGSNLSGIQVVIQGEIPDLTTGSCIATRGTLVETPGRKQIWEIQGEEIELIGPCPVDYPLQKKRHSFEFLRTLAHLRPRTHTQGAVMRVRNHLAMATHRFFQERHFLYVQTPMITASDCEGGGQQFTVTTMDLANLPKTGQGEVDFTHDFFGKKAFLTVSGQLNGEALACALSDVYTFGPTFRAENSHTARHLAEFWMIEPEMAFATLEDVIECAESYLKFAIQHLLKHGLEDLQFFDTHIEKGLMGRLEQLAASQFARLSYTEAITILQKSNKIFEYPPIWGHALQTEHERFLSEVHCQGPVVITNYPKGIKAFYMRVNEDEATVAAMDVLVPKIGEIIGGSQREERRDILEKRMIESGLAPDDYA